MRDPILLQHSDNVKHTSPTGFRGHLASIPKFRQEGYYCTVADGRRARRAIGRKLAKLAKRGAK